jgi:hypothetical protein
VLAHGIAEIDEPWRDSARVLPAVFAVREVMSTPGASE